MERWNSRSFLLGFGSSGFQSDEDVRAKRYLLSKTESTELATAGLMARDVRYWHKADMPIALLDVRFWG
jgi:hypothetical protein